MFVLVYAVAVAAFLVAWSASGQPLSRREQRTLRAVLLVLAILFAVVGVAAVVDLAGDPEHGLRETPSAYAVFGCLAFGGAVYATGVVLWSGRAAWGLRVAGWLLMILALVVPSQLTFGLPLVAVLAVGLNRARYRAAPPSQFRSSPFPHRG